MGILVNDKAVVECNVPFWIGIVEEVHYQFRRSSVYGSLEIATGLSAVACIRRIFSHMAVSLPLSSYPLFLPL